MNVETLKVGEIALVSAKKVNGGKIQLEFAQKINLGNKSQSILSLLNKSDDRFQQTDKPRYAWMSGEAADIKNLFGIDTATLLNVGDVMELDILNPTIQGQPLNIRIIERPVSALKKEEQEYFLANIEKKAKRKGKDGDFILTDKGEYIDVKTDVVAGTANHILIASTPAEATAKNAIDEALS
jgi:hypothetical protein